jgi:hypothetical protein
MASTTKLIVWNAALREIAAAPVADTTTANSRQYSLDAAWDHAIEHVLAMEDWGFARRRASLTGTSDTSFPPYLYRFTKPTDFLRKCWVKSSAADEHQADHAEIAAVFYGMTTPVLLEYVSDHADNYNPANWPPHFTRVLTLYLASLVAPKLARAGADDLGRINGQMQNALAEASEKEAVFLTNTAIATNRLPVMRRALEFMGQQLAGSMSVHAHTDMLRWHMNRSWDHALKYILEMGAWNFATRRATLTDGEAPTLGGMVGGVTEGYSLGPADTEEAAADLPDMAGFSYGHTLPSDFLHKIWVKPSATAEFECRHQFIGSALYTDLEDVVLEYVSYDSDARDPANWSANFTEVMAAYLALLVTPELMVMSGSKGLKVNAAHSGLRDKLEALYRDKLSDAKLRDAIQQEPKRMPLGRFIRARFGSIGTTSIRRYN